MKVLFLGVVDAAVWVPVLAALVTGLSAWGVQAWRIRREAGDQAAQALRHFRDPLLRAAFDLQSRLYNIAARGFLSRYWLQGTEQQRGYARWSTLWLFGQYLGWVEILRREVQYLDLGSKAANEALQLSLNQVSAAIASDSHGRNDLFIIFRSDQRAIGEFMVVSRPHQLNGRPDCLGYSEFTKKLAALETAAARGAAPEGSAVIVSWAKRFTGDLEVFAAATQQGALPARLVGIQRRLIDLLDLLDGSRVRYPHLDYRGRLPDVSVTGPPDRRRIAHFIWPWDEPWGEVQAWANAQGLKLHSEGPARHLYRARRRLSVRRLEVAVSVEEKWISIEAGLRRWEWVKGVDGSLRTRRSRRALNDLLTRFDRPRLAGGETLPDRVAEWSLGQWRRLRVVAGDRES